MKYKYKQYKSQLFKGVMNCYYWVTFAYEESITRGTLFKTFT